MKSEHHPERRSFLKMIAVGGVVANVGTTATMGRTSAATGIPDAPVPADAAKSPATMSAQAAVSEATPRDRKLTYESCGGDYMVDVMRGLGIEFFAATPGNTFMGLHEAVINYGMLSEPKLSFLTTLHEEASVAMAHGYAKIEGKPMACAMHTTVGIQHAAMAIYNAWCDRVPIFMIVGASNDAATRKSGVTWAHSAQDSGAMVRDFVKWDDRPGSLTAWGEAATRGYKFAMTPPYGPVLLATDTLMQEDPYPGGKAPPIPPRPRLSPPVGDPGAIDEIATMLVAAEAPVIYADRMARTPDGLTDLVELAELLQVSVCDTCNRFNFPWRHPLNQTQRQLAVVRRADLLLQLEPGDPFFVSSQRLADGTAKSLMKPGSKRVTISSTDLFMKSNYQDFQRYASDIDLALAADAQATLPSLIEAVKRRLPASRKAAIAERGVLLAEDHAAEIGRSKAAAAFGWNDQPISTGRLYAELYEQIRREDWSFLSISEFQSRWAQQLWTANKHYQYIGSSGGYGIGYLGPATLGAALANKKHGRLSIAINGDGDTMFGPGVLWTAAHERIPLLLIVHNNRCYHQEIMQLQLIANRRQRGVDRVKIGCEIADPFIDFATVAKGLGVYGQGPIENPSDLGPAIRRAIAVVKKGEPALIDVVSQGR